MEPTYSQCGDYLLPDFVLTDTGSISSVSMAGCAAPIWRNIVRLFTALCCSRKSCSPILQRPMPPALRA